MKKRKVTSGGRLPYLEMMPELEKRVGFKINPKGNFTGMKGMQGITAKTK
jgi:hypothetical protein